MKKTILILLLFGLSIFSCNDENEKEIELNTEPEKIYSIIGEWIWLKSYGGFSGHTLETPENTGVNSTLIFSNNDTVIIIENSDTINVLEYYLSREESYIHFKEYNCLTINYKFRISGMDSIITLPMRYLIENLTDTLTLAEDVYDGFGHQYVRYKIHEK